MKHIYSLLFLTTNSFSIICMEQYPLPAVTPKPRQCKSHTPSFSAVNLTGFVPMNVPHPTMLETMSTSQANQHDKNEIELKPIYRPIPTNITLTKKQIEIDIQRPLLHTITPIQPTITKKELYDKVFNTIKNLSSKNLITLIADMHHAKQQNISEDDMMKYSYDQWAINKKGLEERTILFFGYLKHYNLTVNKTKELLPNIKNLYKVESVKKNNNQLAKILDLTSPSNIAETHYVYDKKSAWRNYPAFCNLENSTESHYFYSIRQKFLSYVFSDEKTPLNDYSQLSYDDLKNKFYELASCIIHLNCFYDEKDQNRINSYLYDLIKIIEAGTKLTPQKQEHDFGYDIIETELTTTEAISTFISPIIKIADNVPLIKKRIALICNLIKKYNKQRDGKITPTYNQVQAYDEAYFVNYEPSHFALPDSFDRTLLHHKTYAFGAFKQLLNNISILRCSSDENIQECINQLYPPRK